MSQNLRPVRARGRTKPFVLALRLLLHDELYRYVVKALHTATVASTIALYPPSRVFQRKPPDISKEEISLRAG